MSKRSFFLGLALSVLLTFPAVAQAPSTAVSDGWHTVRPGESLWVIAARYLGDEKEWATLHALNPQIKNPHLISPGMRVRVQIEPQYSGDLAKVVKVSRRVEEQLTPHPWKETSVENLLNPRDGMRTYEDSSSEILFADNSRLVVSEDSIVFLGRGGTVERQVQRDEIEIVIGQGDFDAGVEAKSREFVVGSSRMMPSDGDAIQTRLRRSDAGNSQVMVYEGEGEVASGGSSQQLERGTGTQMKDGEPPAPPERLLTATELLGPEAASEWRVGNPPFSWSPVEGAESYVLEVCSDAECGRLVSLVGDLKETGHRTLDLGEGDYFWRVTPVSPSGLDGYPSAALAFTILSTGNDVTPPTIATSFTGTQIERNARLYLGVGAMLEVEVEDTESGVERTWAELDGSDVDLATASGSWEVGPHEVVIKASDRAGNIGSSEVLAFVYDTVGPEIHWGLESGGLYHSFVGETAPVARVANQRGRKTPRLNWSTDRRDWQAVGEGSKRLQRSQAPRFFLRSARRCSAVSAANQVFLPLKKRKGASVLANDEWVGTEWLDFRVEDVSTGDRPDPRLLVEAVDWLGNKSSVSWPLGRGKTPRPR